MSLLTAEENLLKQKSRIQWLNLGDGNNSFFHNLVKVRNSSNLIKVLMDNEGNSIYDMQKISNMVVNFYKQLLGHSSHEFNPEKADRVSHLFKKKFSTVTVAGMSAPVTRQEIKQVVFAMNPRKAPGADGFSAGFFQKAWPVIGGDLCEAVMEFFSFGQLLREVNSTILTLIPKKKNATSMGDYRPISCYNLVYKCITNFWLIE